MKELSFIYNEDIKYCTYQISNEYDKIGNTCFLGCKDLKYINIPDNIKVIGSDAFNTCVNLRSVKMTNLITEIRVDAFADCPKLEEIYLSDNVELDGEWFNDCTNPNCKVYYRGHIYTVEDIRLYY